VTYIHPSIEPFTRETYGTVVYQEQVMNIVRALGKFSWEDTTSIRKGMAKSMGDEYLGKFFDKFMKGCSEQNIEAEIAEKIWKNIMTFGSWAFNKSHAVSYGLISYWCGWMKAHYPLEYAVACLNNARDDEQGVKILRELVKEGFEYVPVDIINSKAKWSVQDGKLVGGLLNIKGIGEKMAADIFRRREAGEPLTKGQMNKLTQPVTPYDDIFEARRRWGDIYDNPENHKVKSQPISHIIDVQDSGTYIVIAKLKEKNLRDLNEYGSVVKRGGRLIKQNNLFLNMTMEDDTDSIIVTISRWNYAKYGKVIAETGKEGDWYLIKGEVKDNWRKLYVKQLRKLS
jgi:DNA polymerase III alpha subunit